MLMLVLARNHRTNTFQKIIGVWSFAHSAAFGQYRALSRMGLSVSYNTVLSSLRTLSTNAQTEARKAAASHNFILIWDNINRAMKHFSPDLGERNTAERHGIDTSGPGGL
jgi:hypothetical protein